MPSNQLLSPFQVGDLALPNRVIMAPLTRSRASAGDVPNQLMAQYYTQRASAGLIISEASQISPQGQGYACTPGIYSQSQIAGWQQITQAVHQAGGRMAIQLWHVGRISNRLFQPNNEAPVAPSAIKAEGARSYKLQEGKLTRISTDTPKALTVSEIQAIIADYRQAALNAMEAGFDLVELHAANGYLPDQFLSTNSNHRTDQYGSSITNRARFTLEIIDTLIDAIGANKVGVRLSPKGAFNDIDDTESETMAIYLAEQFNKRQIAYIHINEPTWDNGQPYEIEFRQQLRQVFQGPIIVCGAYTQASAEQVINSGHADLVAFGRPYIANADLVERFQNNAELNLPQQESFYGGDEKGYTDYPLLEHEAEPV
ncbi:alkene reductase [Endozoicomonas sp. SM1973]|uniref:Alkene reductase n=1 Tax=Spartinivicinus marinus TaxID=2994442 RepID=A0A853I899_9GAMM|nr:alkene reductase [Spartinivicinus marinus]MCX4027810.1 alkene reductase [Spartinivicinus marinus]NYZ69049.1 alkene reductase [Spartinivicinus marinus]